MDDLLTRPAPSSIDRHRAMAMSRKGPGNLLEVFCYDYGPGKCKCG